VAQAAYARRVEGTASAGLEGIAPAASVLGIPESEFTPKVRDAIMGLMSEVDSLRRELGQTRTRLDEWKRPPTRTACCPCSTAAPLCAS
jgi:hypothetical protein